MVKLTNLQGQAIAACPGHILATMGELGTTVAMIELADPASHMCMGCLKGWKHGCTAGLS